MNRSTVDRLLEPFSFAQFREAHYEKQPLLITRQAPAYYDGLLTLDAINAHLGQGHLLASELRLVRNGELLDVADFASDRDVADMGTDMETVFARFYEGYCIGISSYERHCAAVLRLRHDMERVFHAPVTTDIFVTPRISMGLGAHSAREDRFILQFAGAEEWTVQDGSRKMTLEPGDFLYLPAGGVYEARSANTVSGHIAFALKKYTYADLLRQIADNTESSAWLRRSLPIDFRSTALHHDFLRHVHEFFDDADLPAYLERLHSDFAEECLPDFTNRLADYVRLPHIDAASRCRTRSGVWPELTHGGDRVSLTFNRKSLEFPAVSAESIRFMIDSGEFVVGALPGNSHDNLELCSALVREGFLTIV